MNKDRDPLQSLSAAVLAGGMSTRMGVDKALLSIRPGDPPMAEIVIDRLSTVADDILIIASNRPEYGQFGVRIVPDRYPGSAALGGIATALSAAKHSHCLVVACDMPFLNAALLRELAARSPRNYDVLAPYIKGKSRQGGDFVFQTLHAIYGKACLPVIEQQLAAGNRQVIGFFDSVRVEKVAEVEIRTFDPDLRSFFNANSPEAVEQARRWLDESS
jgi:molybdopterin-guanine dinucleotide biosynthesis protein A